MYGRAATALTASVFWTIGGAAGVALGGVTLQSEARSVSISVRAEGLFDPTASDGFAAEPSGPFAPFEVPTTTRTASTSEAFARGRASQSSSITPSEVRFSGAVFCDARGDSFAGTGTADASSNGQVSFQVDSPTNVRIQGSITTSRAAANVWLVRGEAFVFSAIDGTFDQTITLEPGDYTTTIGVSCSLQQTTSSGATGSGSVGATLTFTPACPCVADFDNSGGTPDLSDISAYFDAWLAGDPSADSDCSGGTPDTSDITEFFREWLAGGC